MSDDQTQLEIFINQSQREIFTRIARADTTNFTELCKLGGLDPASAFRFSNLSGVDFSDCDLSEFDFTGANLAGANFSDCDLSGFDFTEWSVGLAASRIFFSSSSSTSIGL